MSEAETPQPSACRNYDPLDGIAGKCRVCGMSKGSHEKPSAGERVSFEREPYYYVKWWGKQPDPKQKGNGIDHFIAFRAGWNRGVFAARREVVEAVLRLDRPWTTESILERLLEAACTLQDKHNNDRDGWENIQIAIEHGKDLLVSIRAALAKLEKL